MSQALEATPAPARAGNALRARLPLLIELNDLKRVRAAGRARSFAAEVFGRAWESLAAGDDPRRIAERETALAIAAARLGGIDRSVMRDGGLDDGEIQSLLERGFDQVAVDFTESERARFRSRLADELPTDGAGAETTGPPAFVELLARQPRAGATRPGRGRVVLEPAENHAEHCATVAVYGAILAGLYDADVRPPFLAGLAHHLQNAYLPDAGFAADEIIGEHLPAVVRRFRRRALLQLPAALRPVVEEALTYTRDAATPEARAFQAADVLDRVLEMRWHAQSAAFTMDVALRDMDVVHPGDTQDFHLAVMRDAGLM